MCACGRVRGLICGLMEALAAGCRQRFLEGEVCASLLAEVWSTGSYLCCAVVGGGWGAAFPVAPGDRPEDVAALLKGWQSRLDPVRFGNDTLIVLDRRG